MSQENDSNPVGGQIELASADRMHGETRGDLGKIAAAVNLDGATIIRLDAGAGAVNVAQAGASHLRLRVRYLVLVTITAGVITLNVGEETFPFAGGANVTSPPIPFPFVVERGMNLSCTATDGRIYVIAAVE